MQTEQYTRKAIFAPEITCPYQPHKSYFCSASIMPMVIDSKKRSLCCNTEDFDKCPIFLAKVLRGGYMAAKCRHCLTQQA
jgi:hypothetical protein